MTANVRLRAPGFVFDSLCAPDENAPRHLLARRPTHLKQRASWLSSTTAITQRKRRWEGHHQSRTQPPFPLGFIAWFRIRAVPFRTTAFSLPPPAPVKQRVWTPTQSRTTAPFKMCRQRPFRSPSPKIRQSKRSNNRRPPSCSSVRRTAATSEPKTKIG